MVPNNVLNLTVKKARKKKHYIDARIYILGPLHGTATAGVISKSYESLKVCTTRVQSCSMEEQTTVGVEKAIYKNQYLINPL